MKPHKKKRRNRKAERPWPHPTFGVIRIPDDADIHTTVSDDGWVFGGDPAEYSGDDDAAGRGR